MSVITKFLKLFIPDRTDNGTIISDVIDPAFRKIDQNAENNDLAIKNIDDNKLNKGDIPQDWDSAEKIKNKVENGLIFKDSVRQDYINNTNAEIGIYDLQQDELVSGLANFWSVLNFGKYTDAKTQLAFPYQFGVAPEMYFRTANPSGWKDGGWKRVWHDGNFDPSKKLSISGGKITNFVLENISGVDTTIDLKYKGTVGGIYKTENALIMYNKQSKTFLHMYDDGDTSIGANNLKTNAKEIVAGINELNGRFENSPALYEYDGDTAVTNLSVPRLSDYRLIVVKYQVGFGITSPQIGLDITQDIIYMDDQNKHFHLFTDTSRARYIVKDNALVREYSSGEGQQYLIIRKIYGLVKK